MRAKPESDPLRKVPVLLVTAEGRKEDIIRAAQLGATGYIVKPFNKDTVGDKIHLTLKNRNILVDSRHARALARETRETRQTRQTPVTHVTASRSVPQPRRETLATLRCSRSLA